MDIEYDAELPPGVSQRAGDRSALLIQIDNGKAVAAVAICAAICGISMAFSVWSAWTATQAAMEARLLQQHVMKLEALQESSNAR